MTVWVIIVCSLELDAGGLSSKRVSSSSSVHQGGSPDLPPSTPILCVCVCVCVCVYVCVCLCVCVCVCVCVHVYVVYEDTNLYNDMA